MFVRFLEGGWKRPALEQRGRSSGYDLIGARKAGMRARRWGVGAERSDARGAKSAMTACHDKASEANAGLTFPGFLGMIMARHMHLTHDAREGRLRVARERPGNWNSRNPIARSRSRSRSTRSSPLRDRRSHSKIRWLSGERPGAGGGGVSAATKRSRATMAPSRARSPPR